MELEEMQAVWSQMTTELDKQKKLTNEIILKMTQQRYSNKFGKVSTYESIGAVVCFAMAFYILLHFNRLDNWYLILSGIFTLLILLIMPVLVLRSLSQIKRINITNSNYTETLLRYTKAKNQLLLMQRIGIYLGFVLTLVSLPVFGKVFRDKDILLEGQIWSWYMPLMLIFLILFARWGYTCYQHITHSAEDIIRELEEGE
ncbi:hypothetical protein WIW50_11165 [Flavobacteriaceae bacterium 3-367]